MGLFDIGTPVDYDTAYAALYAKNPSALPHILGADTLTDGDDTPTHHRSPTMRTPTAADFELDSRARKSLLTYQSSCHPGHKVTYRLVTLGRTWSQEVLIDDGSTPAAHMHAVYSMDLAHSCEPEKIYPRFGVIYSEITVTASPDGEVTWEIDWDGPPTQPLPSPSSHGLSAPERLVGSIWRDLEMFPRPPERIPVWMKAWMATMGGWDIDNDQPMWTKTDLIGTPVDYDTAYATLYAKNPSILPHILGADTLTDGTDTVTTPPAAVPTAATAEDTATATAPVWPAGGTVDDPAPYTALRDRLERLAHAWPDKVTLIPALTPDDLHRIDPRYRPAAQALPGLTVLAPDNPLGLWQTYTWLPSTPPTQLLHDSSEVTVTADDGHLTVTTRTDPTPVALHATTLDWWTTLTTGLETHLPHLRDEALANLDDDETPDDDPEGFTDLQNEILLTLTEDHLNHLLHLDT